MCRFHDHLCRKSDEIHKNVTSTSEMNKLIEYKICTQKIMFSYTSSNIDNLKVPFTITCVVQNT